MTGLRSQRLKSMSRYQPDIPSLARQILHLTPRELGVLNEILKGEGGEAVGVREPRRPLPPEDEGHGWPEPAPLPEDYWESAQ